MPWESIPAVEHRIFVCLGLAVGRNFCRRVQPLLGATLVVGCYFCRWVQPLSSGVIFVVGAIFVVEC